MDNYIIGIDGSFIVGYSLTLFEKFSLGEDDYDTINKELNITLRDLPDSVLLCKQDFFLEKEYDNSSLPNTNYIQRSYKKYWQGYKYMDQKTYLFFINRNSKINRKDIINPFKIPSKNKFEEFDNANDEFLKIVNTVTHRIKTITLSGKKTLEVSELSKDNIIEHLNFYMSGMNDISVDIKKEWEYLKIGNQYCSILTFPKEDKFPEKNYTCVKDINLSTDNSIFYKNNGDFLGLELNFNHIYNQICAFENNAKVIGMVENNQKNFFRSRKISPQFKKMADLLEEDSKELIKDNENTRFLKGHNNIIIFAPSLEVLEKRISETIGKIKDLNLVPKRVYGDNLLAIYFYSHPLYSTLFVENHYYLTTLQNFLTYYVLTGKYNDDKEGIYYNSRISNIPVKVDCWDDNKKYMRAKNFFIIGPTGYGKSFNALHILSYYSTNSKIVIVDLGGSYQKLALLNPQKSAYIAYEEGQKLGIDPFEKKGELTALKIEDLTEFIIVHYRRDNLATHQERATLRKIVEYYYLKNRKNTFTDFIIFCNENKEEIIKKNQILYNYFDYDEYLLLINEFGPNGIYSFLYDDTSKSIYEEFYKKDIVIFELEKIRNNQLLLMIMLQLISVSINDLIWTDTSKRGVLILDEVAEQLHWDGMLRRVEYIFQTARKKESAIGIILQSINQLPKNESSDSIIENTDILYVIYSKDYEAIKKRFNLSDHAFYQLCSLKSDFSAIKPYSEVFIKRGAHHQVYRLSVDKKTWWAYQTDGAVNKKLMDKYYELNSMEKAIDYMIDND